MARHHLLLLLLLLPTGHRRRRESFPTTSPPTALDEINLGTEASLASAAALDVVNVSNGGAQVVITLNTANVGNGTGEGTAANSALTVNQRETVVLSDSSNTTLLGYVDDEGLLIRNTGPGLSLRDAATPTATIGNQFRYVLVGLGTNGNDTLTLDGANGGNVYLNGGNGDDTLAIVNSSPYYIDGGAGNDTIDGRSGSGIVLGGSGNDEISVDSGGVMVQGGDGTDTATVTGLNYNAGSSDANFTGIEIVRAAAGTDNITISLFSQTEAFTLQGNAGNNNLGASNTGDDSVSGGLGNDSLRGEGGNDTLDGGDGLDRTARRRRQSTA